MFAPESVDMLLLTFMRMESLKGQVLSVSWLWSHSLNQHSLIQEYNTPNHRTPNTELMSLGHYANS